jgi:hypothetical protein
LSELAIVDGEYSDVHPTVVPPGQDLAVTTVDFDSMFQVVPFPRGAQRLNADGEPVPYFVKPEALSRKTPKTQVKIHPKGFAYAPIGFYTSRANEYAGEGFWAFRRTFQEIGDPYTIPAKGNNPPKTYKLVRCGGWALLPGRIPQYGEGDAPWAQDDQGDPRFSLTTALNSAESNAIKNALKKFGIGNDVKEDAEANQYVAGQQATAKAMWDMLVKADRKDDAEKVLRKLAPTALRDGVFLHEMLTEDNVDDVLEKLSAAVSAK